MINTSALSLKALKKESCSGSYQGMRYYLTGRDDIIDVYIYPEPWCFNATPDENKIKKEFPFSQDGLNNAVDWINDSYSQNSEKWEQ